MGVLGSHTPATAIAPRSGYSLVGYFPPIHQGRDRGYFFSASCYSRPGLARSCKRQMDLVVPGKTARLKPPALTNWCFSPPSPLSRVGATCFRGAVFAFFKVSSGCYATHRNQPPSWCSEPFFQTPAAGLRAKPPVCAAYPRSFP